MGRFCVEAVIPLFSTKGLPNAVKIAKKVAEHESETLEAVTQARGIAATVRALLSGHGDVNLRGLEVSDFILTASGMGDVYLNAKKLTGDHSGHGDVYVKRDRCQSMDLRETGMGALSYI